MRNSVFATCQSPWFNMACCCPSSPAAYTKSTPGRADFECCVHSLLILLPLKSMFARWKWTRASKPIQIDLTRDRYTPFMALSCLTEDPSIGFFFFFNQRFNEFPGVHWSPEVTVPVPLLFRTTFSIHYSIFDFTPSPDAFPGQNDSLHFRIWSSGEQMQCYKRIFIFTLSHMHTHTPR